MATSIADLSVKLSANGAALQSGLSKAAGQVQKFADNTTKSLSGIMSGKSIYGSLLGGGAFATAIEAKLGQLKDLGKEARKVGMDVKSFSLLMAAAGPEAEAMGRGILFMRRDLGKVGIGRNLADSGDVEGGTAVPGQSAGKATAMKYAAMGLDAVALRSMTVGQRLAVVADRMHQLTNEDDKAALAVAVFGRAGQQLVPILEGGSAKLARHTKALAEMGMAISPADVAAANDAKWAIKQNALAWSAMTKDLAVSLAPVIKFVADLTGTVRKSGLGTMAAGMAIGGAAGGLKGAIVGGLVGGFISLGQEIYKSSPRGVEEKGIAEAKAREVAMAQLKNEKWTEAAKANLAKGITDVRKSGNPDVFINGKDGPLSKYGQGVERAMDAIRRPLSAVDTVVSTMQKFQDATADAKASTRTGFFGNKADTIEIDKARRGGADRDQLNRLKAAAKEKQVAEAGAEIYENINKNRLKAYGIGVGPEEARAFELRKRMGREDDPSVKAADDIAVKLKSFDRFLKTGKWSTAEEEAADRKGAKERRGADVEKEIEEEAKSRRLVQAAEIRKSQESPLKDTLKGMDSMSKMVAEGVLTGDQKAQELTKNFDSIDKLVNAEVGHMGAQAEGSQAALSTINSFNRRGMKLDPDATLKAYMAMFAAHKAAAVERGRAIEAAIKANRLAIVKM